MDIRDIYLRITTRLKALELSPRKASLQSGLSADAIRNIERAIDAGKTQGGVTTATLAALAETLEVSPEWLLTGRGDITATVPLVGRVGAGAQIDMSHADETDDPVEAPPNAKPGTVAVLVEGDSMFPAFEGHETLYYSDNLPPAELVNRRCVVRLADGRTFVKVLRAGRDGLWNLESLNALYPTMTDVAVEWAAKIDWVKPR